MEIKILFLVIGIVTMNDAGGVILVTKEAFPYGYTQYMNK